MMADDWVVPLVPLRLSVIIPNKAVKIGTTEYVSGTLRVWL